MKYRILKTPIGSLLLAGESEDTLSLISLPEGKGSRSPGPAWTERPRAFSEAASQLLEYFAGERRSFQLDLAPRGTEFQLTVWNALAEIPYGSTVSYGELAEWIGRPRASRAVGAANGQNPLPIVLPCHRVIGSDGSLTGYGGGLRTKRLLLELEGAPAAVGGAPAQLELAS